VVDLKVIFYDGKQHPVDSKDIAFQMAGKQAFREAFMSAQPCLLEPVLNVEIKVPEDYMGDVMGDISSRRGKIMGVDTEGTFQRIKAQVPQSDLYHYSTTLRSLTGGRGIHSEELSHYEEVPRDMETKVTAAAKAAQEES
jgi:elongation factor G